MIFHAYKSEATVVASSNTSHLAPHPGFYRLLMKGIFDAYVLLSFGKKFIFELVTHVRTRDCTVSIETLDSSSGLISYLLIQILRSLNSTTHMAQTCKIAKSLPRN